MSNETIQEMENILKLQKKLYVEEGIPSLELRQDRLSRSIEMIKKYHKETLVITHIWGIVLIGFHYISKL